MEERSPGGFGPTKWAQFANSPPAWAPRTSGRGRFFPAGERTSAAPQAAAARRVGFATALGSPAGSASGGGGGGGTGKMAAELLFPPPL